MAQLGNERRVYIVTAGDFPGTLTWLTGEQTNSYNLTSEALETSDKSTIWAQFISGKRGATLEVTVYVDDTNAQQKTALNALYNGEEIKVFVGAQETSGGDTVYRGDLLNAIVTAISDTNDNGSVATRNISLTVNGEPNTLQPA